MVKPEHVAEGIVLFAESELLPALEGWRLWTGAAMIALASQRVNDVMASLKNNKAVSALGLIDKDGLIDVKAACDALKQTARKHGKLSLDLPVFDVTFNFTEQNIETLRGYIEQAAGVQERE